MIFSESKIYTSIIGLFSKGQERSVKAKKNILFSFLIKGLSIAISLILVPLTINYVNTTRYGIWLTLSSIIGWFVFFDIGLTQGLRNKFAEAKANGNHSLAQIYVSTTYALLAIIFFGVWLLFMGVNFFLDWSKILNVSGSMEREVTILAIIVFSYFCLNFVFNIITTVNTANQQPARSSLISVTGQILSLAIVVLLVKTTEGSLIKLALAFCLSPLLVLFLANLLLYNGVYKQYRPKFSKVDFSYSKSLFNLGLTFFIIQFANILQFQSANIIIAQNFGVAEVTSYQIVYRYFGVMIMVFTIFLTPFWSASTEAFLKNDIQWIKNAIKRYNQLNIIMVVIGLIMLVSSGTVYRLWLGEGKVHIDFILSLCGFLFFNTSVFGGKYVSFLNGISALRIQFWASVISPFLYILVTLILLKYFHMGVYSLFIAAIIANFNTYIIAPIQYHQIIIRNKRGIWVK